MDQNDKITKTIIEGLINEKLSPGKAVDVKREWSAGDENTNVSVYQDGAFKFFIACETNDESLSKMEELLAESLKNMGYSTTRTYSH